MPTVMVFGTFDMIHLGHEHYLREAKKYGQKLIVVIARDRTVKEIKKKAPLHSEKERKRNMIKSTLAETVILGNLLDKYAAIKKYRPHVIALGYDQKAFTEKLSNILKELGLESTKIIRLRSYKPEIYKTSKLLKR